MQRGDGKKKKKARHRGKTNGVKADGQLALWMMLFVQEREPVGRSLWGSALSGQSFFQILSMPYARLESIEQQFCGALHEK